MLYYIIYNIIIYSIQPIILIRLLILSINTPSYRKEWYERYGFYKKNIKQKGIILHSVSVGETLAAIPLIQALQKKYPHLNITLTSTTPTGKELGKSVLGNTVNYSYLPYDLPCSIKRFINYTQPILVITLETELWPNLIKILYKQHIPFIVANARLSLQSFTNYKKIKKFIALTMQYITLIAAQNEKDGARFIELGLKKKKLTIIGNIKFDRFINQDTIQKIKIIKHTWTKNRYTWIAGSTHKGEEKLLLQTHINLLTIFPNLLLILAPRHKERCNTIINNIIHKTKLNYIRRSSGKDPSNNTHIIIIDTIGELMFLYGAADLAFIGGSLVQHGGHNPIEAAAHGIPILVGPHTFNFHNIYQKMIQSQSVIQIHHKNTLEKEIYKLLTNKNYRLTYGKNAIQILQNNKGALKKLLPLLDDYLF